MIKIRAFWIAFFSALILLLMLASVLGLLIFGRSQVLPQSSRAQHLSDSLIPDAAIYHLSDEQRRALDAVRMGAAKDDPNVLHLPTPTLASYGDVLVHSPISPKDLTEIEFHQASYDHSLKLTALVSIVDADSVAKAHGTLRIDYTQQPYGDAPLVAQAVSTWRMYSEGDEMTAVDVGAKAGTVVYAPVSGTVVKIASYTLFDQVEDYEIHIQDPAHPELDIVVLHVDGLLVEVGDTVCGGATRIAHVRDIGQVIDNNLANFTAPDDPGNHCHVQINDTTRTGYRGLDGALDIFSEDVAGSITAGEIG